MSFNTAVKTIRKSYPPVNPRNSIVDPSVSVLVN